MNNRLKSTPVFCALFVEVITDWEVATDLLRGLTIMLEPKMRPVDTDFVWSLIDVGEGPLAYDTFCTQLYEYDTEVREDIFATLGQLGKYYNFESSMWEVLRRR